MFHCGESYDGERTSDGKRMHNRGVLKFESGAEYKGEFDDGRFNKQGVVHFTPEQGGGQFRATWNMGVAEEGEYVYVDGLSYSTTDWQYSTPSDRRFWNEHLTFVTPALPPDAAEEDVIVPDYSAVE